jgi:hypothetical protein
MSDELSSENANQNASAVGSSVTSELATPGLTRTLSRTQLTLALILVTITPFLLVIGLYFTLPNTPEPVLPAEIRIGPEAWPSRDAPNARLVPCLIVKNPTADEWNNIHLAINEQFYFFQPEPLRGGGQIQVPLKFFHTKGNQFFPPEKQTVKLITVYAQIPDGSRAVVEWVP